MLKRSLLYGVVALMFMCAPLRLLAQGPEGRDFGFGICLFEPLGATIKYWTAKDEAISAAIGGSYFGNPRLNADYVWHFQAFNSNVVSMYAGPGLSVGFGQGSYYLYYTRNGDVFYARNPGTTGFGIHVSVGIDVMPRRTPIELYLEAGPLIGISPGFGAAFDVGLGIRFYP